jgi:hypothetical protein
MGLIDLFQNCFRKRPLPQCNLVPSIETEEEGIGESIEIYTNQLPVPPSLSSSERARLHLCDVKVMLCAKAITYFTQEFDRKREASRFFFSYDVESNHINYKYANFVSQVTVCKNIDDLKKIWLYSSIILVQESTKPWRFSQENV